MLRKSIISLCAAVMLALPSTSQAGLFDWWHTDSCNSCDPCGTDVTTVRYRPLFSLFPRFGLFRARRVSYYGASYSADHHGCGTTSCSPCATQCYSPCATKCCSPCVTQTVRYVPQTSYRAYTVNVPVTTYQCYRICDPCTGCRVTVRRPVTTYVRQVRYQPVTTYRAVCCPTTCYSPCASCSSSCCQSPCGSCNGHAAAKPVVPQIVVPQIVVPQALPQVVPGTPNGENSVPQTFKEGSSTSFRRSTPSDLKQNGGGFDRGSSQPRDLTTSLPRRTWTFQRVSSRTTVQPQVIPAKQMVREQRVSQPLNDGGWRTAKR